MNNNKDIINHMTLQSLEVTETSKVGKKGKIVHNRKTLPKRTRPRLLKGGVIPSQKNKCSFGSPIFGSLSPFKKALRSYGYARFFKLDFALKSRIPNNPLFLGKDIRLTLALLSTTLMTACSTFHRLPHVGQEPAMTHLVNPKALPDYRPVTMPMPKPRPVGVRHANSLWQTGARAFFKDQRASRVGDILTVLVDIDDKADLSNETFRSREASEKSSVSNFMGLEDNPEGFLPQGVKPTSLVGLSTNPVTKGKGTSKRNEKIQMKIPATITQILPNGNMVLMGRQEVRVNFETREFVVAGIIRSSDISSSNTVNYTKMAEARISYGGRGIISEFQQPAYGQQIVDIITPF